MFEPGCSVSFNFKILGDWDTGNFNHVSATPLDMRSNLIFSGNIVSVGVFDDPVFMGTVVCNHSMNRNGDIEFFLLSRELGSEMYSGLSQADEYR